MKKEKKNFMIVVFTNKEMLIVKKNMMMIHLVKMDKFIGNYSGLNSVNVKHLRNLL